MSKQSKEYWRKKKAEQRLKRKAQGLGVNLDKLKEKVEDLGGAVEAGSLGEEATEAHEGPDAVPAGSTPAPPVDSMEVYFHREKPDEATRHEWDYALVRASRAREYARKMPEHVRPSEVRYQDPLWQWENQVKGRTLPC